MQLDKGFKRCGDTEGFICQKKNHFQVRLVGLAGNLLAQVTISLQMMVDPAYIGTPRGMQRVSGVYILMHGIKIENPDQHVILEQSQADRSKKAFKPVPLNLLGNEMCRVTIGRLHFGEPTANNMRKKGKPNPDQRFFGLVVSIAARAGVSLSASRQPSHHVQDEFYTIVSHVSDNIVVRASNPRQFESDTVFISVCTLKLIAK